MLEGARLDGRPVVADGWLEVATRKQADIGAPGRGYGYQWWTADDGTFSAIGIHGQQIHVDPGRRLVVAINSAWPQASFTPESLRARIGLLSAIKKALDSEWQGALGNGTTGPPRSRVARLGSPATCTASAALSASFPLERPTRSSCLADR